MIFILSQLIAVAIFLLVWKLKELISNQNTYMKLLKEEVPKAAKLRN
ncbi:MAG: hypothetical protein ABJO28_01090 [Maribacter dokdonensis]|uniref:Uncharacterized protein n=1 Tax=Maribacter dokdonensis TaxID=320912 RepID=A0A1H4LHR5_9FLAO|nr:MULTISPECIES: hypothetical protein [Maribacter]KSA12663.1 hypothetical protein I600_2096 [Maribacter dokdonensis DSW-8]MBU2900422.1 hypothetical protein [Maribacter dokdonensis]MDF4220034.1 hypothetical protein [Maribacter huludaoensis]MDP2526571.1 hypothetical protein [Maribacter dokdonensis]CAG2531596.1 hypothetical protein MAR621_02123 [Maribacter dokdonensis]|tara:strand:+ start:451 stop:591 length:141 start_codon:yes stop_codon:yes gene_type:complete